MTASLRLSGHQTLDIATYSCPWVNTWVLSQIPAYFSVCPRISLLYSCLIKSFYLLCDLLMVIANPSFTGNCLRYQVNGYSGRMLKLYITFVPVIRTSKHFWLLQCIWHQTMIIYDVLPLAATETIVYGHRSSGIKNFGFEKWCAIL